MAANSSIVLTNLDFDAMKNTLRSYLRSQDRFQDYDFEGSNMSVLLDILAYNTYHNAFYLNMIGSEMFLDTAVLRDSVVSHAKELNYVPRSFKSAVATVNLQFTDTDLTRRSVTIPKGTSFTARVGANNFTFTTDQIIVTNDSVTQGANIVFTAPDVQIYEGNYTSETFTINRLQNSRIVLNNPNIDTSSVSVTVVEDLGATTIQYLRATSLFGLNADSKVFFIQGAVNGNYEVVFGDGVVGRIPKDNSIVIVEYRVSKGELPNGAFVFKNDGAIDQLASVAVTTVQAATSGAVAESIDSIKYNAPRHFTTQERAITTEDYETLLKLNFPEINNVAAYGGEEANPPQYGKVFVAVDLKNVDGLPDVKRDQFYKFLKPRSPVAIDPVFVPTDYTYVLCDSIVRYNVNVTNLNIDDIRTRALSAILDYSSTNLNGFNKTLRYSKLIQSIDDAHPSIVSNELQVNVIKYYIPQLASPITFTLDYGIPILKLLPDAAAHPLTDGHSFYSTPFIWQGQRVYLEDNGIGNIRIVGTQGLTHRELQQTGTIDYDTGIVTISNLVVDAFEGSTMKFYIAPRSKDIFSTKNSILNISEADVTINIEQIRE